MLAQIINTSIVGENTGAASILVVEPLAALWHNLCRRGCPPSKHIAARKKFP